MNSFTTTSKSFATTSRNTSFPGVSAATPHVSATKPAAQFKALNNTSFRPFSSDSNRVHGCAIKASRNETHNATRDESSKLTFISTTMQAMQKADKEKGKSAFEADFSALQEKHPVFAHPAFETIGQLAKEGKLSAHQFAQFRQFMLARNYLTMSCIADYMTRYTKQALTGLDAESLMRALQTLGNTSGKGEVSIVHCLRAEQAFNAIGRSLGLPDIKMEDAYKEMRSTSSAFREYEATARKLYGANLEFVVLAQEAAFEGDGTTGMKSNLSAIFSAFYESMGRDRMSENVFDENVLPYVAKHLMAKDQRNHLDDVQSRIEHKPVSRAKENAVRWIQSTADAKSGMTAIRSFLDAQNKLLNEMEDKIEPSQSLDAADQAGWFV